MVKSRIFSILAATMLLAVLVRAQDQLPRFRATTQATLLDVAVLDATGQPITDLRSSDFSVSVDGKKRRVLSAEWVPLASRARDASAEATPPVPVGYTSNQASRGGRLIAIVIDQGHITFGGTTFMRAAVKAFIDRLEPADRVAMIGLCPGGPKPVPFTTDRDAVKEALSSMVGQWTVIHNAGPTAPGARRGFSQNAPDVGAANIPLSTCGGADASGGLGVFEGTQDEDAAWQEIRTLLVAMKEIDGPKTLIMVSEGLARPTVPSIQAEIERQAAAAHATIYGILLDRRVPDTLVRGVDEAVPAGSFEGRDGLSAFVNATGGALFTAAVTADPAIARIESEISGYYVVGVESQPDDRDGEDRSLSVSVNRSGAIVRARRWLNTGRHDAATQTAADRIQAAFGSFTPYTALSIRVGTFALRQPGNARLYVLLHAEIGDSYTVPVAVSLGVTITDREGRLVGAKSGTSQLLPLLRDRPSPLELTTSVALPQGDYLLKLAVVEGERIGSLEGPLHVGFAGSGPIRLSDLIVGGAPDAKPSAHPAVGSVVRSGFVQGYLEAYGPGVAGLHAVYEVLQAGADRSLSTLQLPAESADAKAVFSGVVDVHGFPPGLYVLRATVSSATGSVDQLSRGFEIPAQ